jgi:TP901 family phage tail tape measure protein
VALRELNFQIGFNVNPDKLHEANAATDQLKNRVLGAGGAADQLGPKLKGAGDAGTKAMKQVGDAAEQVQKRMTLGQTLNDIGSAADKMKYYSAAGFAATAGAVGFATKTFMGFEKGMSRVGALADANTQEMKLLNSEALKLGRDTVFSAAQAAEAMSYLAMSGFKTNEMVAAMPGLLDMASAGQTDLGTTADIAANILRGFQMEAGQSSKVADVLTKTFTSTNTTLVDVGETMKYVAPVAQAVGYSIEEMAAATGLLGNAGIKGSMAGTTLRSAILSLTKPSKEASTVLDKLGVSLVDDQGKMRSFTDIVAQLKVGTEGLDEATRMAALGTVFGERAVSGMMALVQTGPEKLAELNKALEASGGTAKRIAERQLDNLAGSMEQLSGSVETAHIAMGDKFAPAVRWVADGLTKLTNKFTNLPPWMQSISVWGLAGAAGFFGLATAVGFAYPLFVNLGKAMPLITKAGGGMLASLKGIGAFMIGPWGIALGAAAALAFVIWDLWKGFNGGNSVLTPLIDKFLAWTGVGFRTRDIINGIIQVADQLWKCLQWGWQYILGPLVNEFVAGFRLIYGVVSWVVGFMAPMFKDVWGGAVDFLRGSFQFLLGSVQTVFGFLRGVITGDFSTFKAGLENLGNGIKTVFGGLWQVVTAPITFIQTKLSEFLTWVSTKFNIGQVIGQRIQAGINMLPGPLKSMAQKILNYLPQSPAKEGPLSTIDQVGPGLMGTVGSSILDNANMTTDAMAKALRPLAGSLQAPELPAITPSAYPAKGVAGSTVNNTRAKVAPSIVIQVNGTGDPMKVAANVAQEVRRVLDQIGYEWLGSIVPEEV